MVISPITTYHPTFFTVPFQPIKKNPAKPLSRRSMAVRWPSWVRKAKPMSGRTSIVVFYNYKMGPGSSWATKKHPYLLLSHEKILVGLWNNPYKNWVVKSSPIYLKQLVFFHCSVIYGAESLYKKGLFHPQLPISLKVHFVEVKWLDLELVGPIL